MKRALRFWPLLATIYFCVSGGPQGLEEVMQSGLGLGLLLILVTPLVWALPAALMAAELGSAIPVEGGYVVWVREALGQPWSFLCGWWTWVYSWIDVAIYPVLFAEYMGTLAHMAGLHLHSGAAYPFLKWAVGLLMIVPFTYLNVRGVKPVGSASLLFSVVLLTPFAILVLAGVPVLLQAPAATFHPFVSPGSGAAAAVSSGLFVVMWNYLGWDSMSTVAGETDNPRLAFPKALMVGVPLVAATYFLPALIGTEVLRDPSKWERGAWPSIGSTLVGPWLGVAIGAVSLISAAGLFSAGVLAASRVPFVLAEDGLMPKRLTKLHPRWGTPWVAILVSACFYTLFSVSAFKSLAVMDVIVYSAGVSLEFAALVALRVKQPNLERPFRIGGGWIGIGLVVLLPLTILILAIADRLREEHSALVISAIALATGPAAYLIFKHRRGAKVPSAG